MKILSCQGK